MAGPAQRQAEEAQAAQRLTARDEPVGVVDRDLFCEIPLEGRHHFTLEGDREKSQKEPAENRGKDKERPRFPAHAGAWAGGAPRVRAGA